MSTLADFYGGYWKSRTSSFGSWALGATPFGVARDIYRGYENAYENSHGGTRYALSQIPVLGKIKQYQDEKQKYNDEYENTGLDYRYSSSYGSSGIPLVNDLNNLARPARMVNKLSQMYGVEVQLDVIRARHALAIARTGEANAWTEYEKALRRY